MDTNWYADTGATNHITNDPDRLTNRDRYEGGDQVQVANGTCLSISYIGNSTISGCSRPLATNILHVPLINKHLVSSHKLASANNAYFEFHSNHFCVKDRATRTTLLRRPCDQGLYPLSAKAHRSYSLSLSRCHENSGISDLVIQHLP